MPALDALSAQIDLYKYCLKELRLPIPEDKGLRRQREITAAGGWILESASAICVADWVVDALEDAVNTFPADYKLSAQDVPFPVGYAALARPIMIHTRVSPYKLDEYGGSYLWLTGIGWGISGNAVLVVPFGKSDMKMPDTKTFRSLPEPKTHTLLPFDSTLADLAEAWGEMDVDPHATFVVEDHTEQFLVDVDMVRGLKESEAGFLFRFLASLWLFMGEKKLVSIQEVGVPRALRREMQRDRIPFEPKFQTIVLRSVQYTGERGFEERPRREFDKRFVVRGHWHRFWTGKKDGSEERRLVPKWVSAYVKGPEDAPLNAPLKIFAVTR